jgi:hypothetical protein
MKWNPPIFWLPLLIGHALLSNHGSTDDAVALLADFSGMCG